MTEPQLLLQISLLNESPVLLLLDPTVDRAKHKDLPVTLYESGMAVLSCSAADRLAAQALTWPALQRSTCWTTSRSSGLRSRSSRCRCASLGSCLTHKTHCLLSRLRCAQTSEAERIGVNQFAQVLSNSNASSSDQSEAQPVQLMR